jgi:hypothetical protein
VCAACDTLLIRRFWRRPAISRQFYVQVLITQLKEKSDECDSKVSGSEREMEEALEDKKRSDFQNTQTQLQASA